MRSWRVGAGLGTGMRQVVVGADPPVRIGCRGEERGRYTDCTDMTDGIFGVCDQQESRWECL